MSTNNDLGDIVTKKEEEEVQAPDVSHAEAFDIHRKARKEQLDKVRNVLNRSVAGAKLDKKSVTKALNALHSYGVLTDDIVSSLVESLYRVIRAVAQAEVSNFALRTNLKTLVRGLESKGIITQEEMRDIHDNQILPEELKNIGGDGETESVMKQKDFEELASEEPVASEPEK